MLTDLSNDLLEFWSDDFPLLVFGRWGTLAIPRGQLIHCLRTRGERERGEGRDEGEGGRERDRWREGGREEGGGEREQSTERYRYKRIIM